MAFIVTIELAHKWLNLDTYWDLPYQEDERLLADLPAAGKRPKLISRPEIISKRKELRGARERLRQEKQGIQANRAALAARTDSYKAELNLLSQKHQGLAAASSLTDIMHWRLDKEKSDLREALADCQRQCEDLHQQEQAWKWSQASLEKTEWEANRQAHGQFMPGQPLKVPDILKQYYYPFDRRSELRDPSIEKDEEMLTLTEQLVVKLRNSGNRGDYSAAREAINHLDKTCEAMNKPRQTAEAKLEIAIALYKMGGNGRALTYLNQCLLGYRTDPHAEAITRWIMGYIQLSDPLSIVEALVNWRKCYEMFASAVSGYQAAANPVEIVRWYKKRAEQMALDLEAAINASPPEDADGNQPLQFRPDPDSPAPNPAKANNIVGDMVRGETAAPSPAQQLFEKALIRFRGLNFSVSESIGAAPLGNNVESDEQTPAETDRLFLDSGPHYLVSVNQGIRVVVIGVEHRFVRVKGDSMNAAHPCPILDGEYVLIRRNAQPVPGQIVAVDFIRDIPEIGRSAIKRLTKEGFRSESTQPYLTVPWRDIEKIVGEVVAVAKPEPMADDRVNAAPN